MWSSDFERFTTKAIASVRTSAFEIGLGALCPGTAEGTELPAIIGALQDYVEQGRERLRLEAEASRRERLLEEKAALKGGRCCA
jgi:hypothetical protein